MKSARFFILLLLLSASIPAFSQLHRDCDTALFLCDKTPMTFDATVGIGQMEDLSNTCVLEEYASTWLRWKIAQAGSLTFILTPDKASDDIDFAIFKLDGTGGCGSKTLVRCMAAGEDFDNPNGSIPCLGSTGLTNGETDVTEMVGCDNGNNNFLAPLFCLAGEEYVMFINNFTLSGNGFSLNWGGNAGFSCDSTSTAANETMLAHTLRLYPNPAEDILHIELLGNNDMANYRIMDGMGRFMESGGFMGNNHEILLNGWSAGMYFLVLEQAGMPLMRRFLVHDKD